MAFRFPRGSGRELNERVEAIDIMFRNGEEGVAQDDEVFGAHRARSIRPASAETHGLVAPATTNPLLTGVLPLRYLPVR